MPLQGKCVHVFGYGGRLDVGMGFLELGAAHVVLCDKLTPPQRDHNQAVAGQHRQYFLWEGKDSRPDPAFVTLFEGDIRDVAASHALPPGNLVASTSVYEHLEDPDGITQALARLTAAGGLNIHFIDLRDHFFRYPFEMLHYSEAAWRRWLNPTSHHNRYRVWDYRRAFESAFKEVEIEILQRDEHAFERARRRIRPEFVSGDLQEDAATMIKVVATHPGG
jgi:hypothetical protein